MELMPHQRKAVEQLGNGKILWGGVGSGKSATVLGYYVENEEFRDIIVITTAKKRDSLDWYGEAAKFGIGMNRGATLYGTITVDSWNNIAKYEHITDAFFIFDEQRVVGTGHWGTKFIKIAKKNHWILLSATPGDNWLDYAPVFIANGFYKNITEFKIRHVVYVPFLSFPKVQGYINERRLEILRNEVLVEMPYAKHTYRHLNYLDMGFDSELFKRVYRDRWNIYENAPIQNAAELFRVLRRVVNSDPSRLEMIVKLLLCHPKLIIYYTFDYELDILRGLCVDTDVYELNGHRHDPVPESDNWVYLVQYVAGAEAWNCITTNAVVMYSLTYSYKNFEQCQGRIDRLNTPFKDLFYYVFVSNSFVDRGIRQSLAAKQTFNERKFMAEILAINERGEDEVEGCII